MTCRFSKQAEHCTFISQTCHCAHTLSSACLWHRFFGTRYGLYSQVPRPLAAYNPSPHSFCCFCCCSHPLIDLPYSVSGECEHVLVRFTVGCKVIHLQRALVLYDSKAERKPQQQQRQPRRCKKLVMRTRLVTCATCMPSAYDGRYAAAAQRHLQRHGHPCC